MAHNDVWKVEQGEKNATLYSAYRMPHSSRKGPMDPARKALRFAVESLEASHDEIVEGVYSSQVDGFFDIENVVFYNVETAAFTNAARNGLRARRCREHSEAATPGFPHRMDYRLVPKPQIPELPLVHLQFEPIGFRSVFDVWWAAGCGTAIQTGAVLGTYGIHVELGRQHRNPARIMKILLDGVIAALQRDPKPDPEVAIRLSQKHQIESGLIEARLMGPIVSAIPPSRSARLVRQFGTGVQWHPADDLCEDCTVVVSENETPTCNVYLYSLGR